MNTIQEKWESYRREVVPADACDVQIEECRRAFFAGAAAILNLTCTVIPDMTEDAGVAMLEGLHEECRGFARAVVADIPTEGNA